MTTITGQHFHIFQQFQEQIILQSPLLKKADTCITEANIDIYSYKSVGYIGKDVGSLTWFGDRNSWLLSFMYMLSPSNCGQKQKGEINMVCMRRCERKLGAREEVRRGKALYGWPEV